VADYEASSNQNSACGGSRADLDALIRLARSGQPLDDFGRAVVTRRPPEWMLTTTDVNADA
jgi:hypothetical protein